MQEEKCPCCPNHCEVGHLNCQRGEKYFETGEKGFRVNEDESLMTLDEKVISKMRKCGHTLHHSKETFDLEFLTEEEKETLITLLSKCLQHWN